MEKYDGVILKPTLDEALEHYGVKGMKWRKRKKNNLHDAFKEAIVKKQEEEWEKRKIRDNEKRKGYNRTILERERAIKKKSADTNKRIEQRIRREKKRIQITNREMRRKYATLHDI